MKHIKVLSMATVVFLSLALLISGQNIDKKSERTKIKLDKKGNFCFDFSGLEGLKALKNLNFHFDGEDFDFDFEDLDIDFSDFAFDFNMSDFDFDFDFDNFDFDFDFGDFDFDFSDFDFDFNFVEDFACKIQKKVNKKTKETLKKKK